MEPCGYLNGMRVGSGFPVPPRPLTHKLPPDMGFLQQLLRPCMPHPLSPVCYMNLEFQLQNTPQTHSGLQVTSVTVLFSPIQRDSQFGS